MERYREILYTMISPCFGHAPALGGINHIPTCSRIISLRDQKWWPPTFGRLRKGLIKDRLSITKLFC